MTSRNPTYNRRPSLCPPHRDVSSPNASMVDASNVNKSIVKHIQQRDQDTATEEEQKEQLNKQRSSLRHAHEIVDYWHKKDLTNDSSNTSNMHIQQEQKNFTTQKGEKKLIQEHSSILHTFGSVDLEKGKNSRNMQNK